MGSNMRSREAMLLGENETRRFADIIEAGSTLGWHSFEQSLCKAYEQDLITEETAMLYSINKSIDHIDKRRQAAHSSAGLKLKSGYSRDSSRTSRETPR
jgi:Tfp pilus assembly ATPase PilU